MQDLTGAVGALENFVNGDSLEGFVFWWAVGMMRECGLDGSDESDLLDWLEDWLGDWLGYLLGDWLGDWLGLGFGFGFLEVVGTVELGVYLVGYDGHQ